MKNFKSYLIDFINFTLIWTIMVFFIYIGVLGSELEFMGNFVKSLIPLAFFVIIFLIKFKVENSRLRKMKQMNRMEINLYLNYYHKYLSQLIFYFLPVLLLSISLIKKSIDVTDLIQATIILVVSQVWISYIFKKV